MIIPTAQDIRHWEAFTMEHEPVESIALMERAAGKCVEWLLNMYEQEAEYLIICGNGNNGGDGLVIARLLAERAIKCLVVLPDQNIQLYDALKDKKRSTENRINLNRLMEHDSVELWLFDHPSLVPKITEYINTKPKTNLVIVDALFGCGLNRPLSGKVSEFIKYLNSLAHHKVAIDIPSGLSPDTIPDNDAAIFRADHTLTFQSLKRSFLHVESDPWLGEVHILDIGLHIGFKGFQKPLYILNTLANIGTTIKYRPRFAHKGTFGTTLVISGSVGMGGAAALVSKAALRTGSGKVHMIVPVCNYPIIQSLVPEATCTISGEEYICPPNTLDLDINGYTAIVIGPGLGVGRESQNTIEWLLNHEHNRLVIDADALNIIASNPNLLRKLPAGSILTPHPGEFRRLAGKSTDSVGELELARNFVKEYGLIMVLKGRYTRILGPDELITFNSTGNPGMATGGSGDVLSGIIGGLLSQGYPSEIAARTGVFLHGLAGDFAADKLSEQSMIATDLIDHLPYAFKHLKDG